MLCGFWVYSLDVNVGEVKLFLVWEGVKLIFVLGRVENWLRIVISLGFKEIILILL